MTTIQLIQQRIEALNGVLGITHRSAQDYERLVFDDLTFLHELLERIK